VWWGNTDLPAPRFVDSTPNYQEVDDRTSDADFLAAFLSLSGTSDEPDDGASLVEPTDFAVLMLIDQPGATTDMPSEGEDLDPAEFGFKIDDHHR
jgi:hypothetical protein